MTEKLSAAQVKALRRVKAGRLVMDSEMHGQTRISLIRLGLIAPVARFTSGRAVNTITDAGRAALANRENGTTDRPNRSEETN